ncbi:ribosomal biogenesis regulatory protein [Pseudomassariella vexata]|uniref:Ribosome biogenesis regulatory protein n=1 Tax=Pseudomassariella vexata TaxID=1141098 RepID=A0A1Y2DFJ6_9PEZI|nr:ribosomal biogenesis regulatory protein [Pseudomassariella vexata]ORY57465.1 ribosomal biogenesis regulatory protein [Pseudomassariella vexata]
MAPEKLDISVDKPTPYTYDLGLLLATDANPLPSPESGSLEERLAATARDGAQALINQMMMTLPIQSTSAGVLMTLPAPETPLPREKPLPAAKEQTKWQAFAARKGIKPKTREQKHMKSQKFNEDTGAWEKTWGYKGKRPEGEVPADWVVEVDEKGEKVGKDPKQKKRRT